MTSGYQPSAPAFGRREAFSGGGVKEKEASTKTTIFLATARGLAVVSSSDRDWRGQVHLHNKHVQCVAADQNRNGVVYCGTSDDGLFKSDDTGATWTPSHSFTKSRVTALAASQSGDIYAGTEPSAIFCSGDNSKSWRELSTLLTLPSAKQWSFPPRPGTHHVRSILPSLAKPGRLHVAVEAGALLRSDDRGVAWRDRVPSGPKDTHTLAVHPLDPSRLHSAAGDGYFESVDDGDHWRRFTEGLQHQYCWSVALSMANQTTTLLLSASSSASTAHFKESASSFVYRRTGDAPWQRVQSGLPEPEGTRIPVLASSRVKPGVFYLSAEGVVYRSEDGGSQWQELSVHWHDATAIEHAFDMAIVEKC